MGISRRQKTNNDVIVLGVICLILIMLGLLNLYSVTTPRGIEHQYYYNQILWTLIGILVSIPILLVDYKKYEVVAYVFYCICIALLIMVFLVGKVAMGAKRWLDLGIFKVQPAEITKIAIIFIIAKFYSERKEVYNSWSIRRLILPLIYIAIPFILVLKQPDLGTATIIFFIGVLIILFNRIKISNFILLLFTGIGASLIAWYKFLKPYQKRRILAFINPESDVLGSAYHSIQSIIAVGSGQLFGKGYMKSTQSQFSFLPEQHTDFIFSIFAEEWGFIGSVIMILICMAFLYQILRISYQTLDIFGKNVAFGIFAYFFLHFSINISMLVGLIPVVGVTFPFLSYGGSSLVSSMFLVGLVINIGLKRGKYE